MATAQQVQSSNISKVRSKENLLKDFESVAASISNSIDSIVQKFPKEFELIGIAALGAAFGCKFTKTTLFLGSIYILGKLLQQRG